MKLRAITLSSVVLLVLATPAQAGVYEVILKATYHRVSYASLPRASSKGISETRLYSDTQDLSNLGVSGSVRFGMVLPGETVSPLSRVLLMRVLNERIRTTDARSS